MPMGDATIPVVYLRAQNVWIEETAYELQKWTQRVEPMAWSFSLYLMRLIGCCKYSTGQAFFQKIRRCKTTFLK
jgi:hypothetical protein